MKKNKENATKYWFENIENSWTWNKLTKEEQNKFIKHINNISVKLTIKGSYNDRYVILQDLYHTFLIGLNYNPINWREEEEQPLF